MNRGCLLDSTGGPWGDLGAAVTSPVTRIQDRGLSAMNSGFVWDFYKNNPIIDG